jgi:peptide/nickel transport system permease protein
MRGDGRELRPRHHVPASAVAGSAILISLVGFCFVGPLLHHTNQTDVQRALLSSPSACPCAPNAQHLLGTDAAGFDVLGRLMVAGRNSLLVGFAAALLASTMGTVYGAFSGLAGGAVDAVMMRVLDVLLSVPTLLLLFALLAVLRPSFGVTVGIVAGTGWLGQARLMRGETRSISTRDYVVAARSLGAGRARVLLRHVVPNAADMLVLNTTFGVADAILVLAALGFLGLGLPPARPDWGSMLGGGINDAAYKDWWLIYPAGLCIVLAVIGCNLVGAGLRRSWARTPHLP